MASLVRPACPVGGGEVDAGGQGAGVSVALVYDRPITDRGLVWRGGRAPATRSCRSRTATTAATTCFR